MAAKKPRPARKRVIPLTIQRALGRCQLYDPKRITFYDANGENVTVAALAKLRLLWDTAAETVAAERWDVPTAQGPREHLVTMNGCDFTPRVDKHADLVVEAERTVKRADPINHPTHYTQGAVECIDAIAAQLTRAQFIGFLRGQLAKYNWCLEAKGDAGENLAKLRWYAERLATVLAVQEEVP